MEKTAREEYLQQTVGKLMGMFESQEFPEQLGWAIIQRKKEDDRKCLHYSINNFMLMLCAGTTWVDTFKGWLAYGRVPRRGSRAIRLVQPILVKDRDDEDNRQKLIGFKHFNTFAYEDTVELEGDFPRRKPIDYTPEVIPELSQKIIAAVRKMGVKVEFKPIEDRPGALGYFRHDYNDGKGLIVLSENSPATIAHEAMHYLHSLEEDITTVENDRAEVIAELGAAVLLAYEGVQGYEQQSWEYLKRYVKDAKSDKEVISRISSVLNMVEKCITRLLAVIEEG